MDVCTAKITIISHALQKTASKRQVEPVKLLQTILRSSVSGTWCNLVYGMGRL